MESGKARDPALMRDKQIQAGSPVPGQEPVSYKKYHRPSVAMGLWIIKRLEKFISRCSTVEDTPVFDSSNFPWTGVLEDNWRTIRTELDKILENIEQLPNFQDISKDQANITRDNRWKTFFLYGYGYKMKLNCGKCPETTRLVESIPGMYTAFFSILAPGKYIPLHRGPYKGLLRCHLALIVPEPRQECWIQVGDAVRHWEEGRCLVFDDTYRHRVQNNTGGMRVVLFLDILRPMGYFSGLVNKLILHLIRWSPFIRDAVRNHKAWERRMGY